jgi:hypothetical protein
MIRTMFLIVVVVLFAAPLFAAAFAAGWGTT